MFVLLIDSSLSMWRPAKAGEVITVHSLAIRAAENIINYISRHCKLEGTALLAFSNFCTTLCPFTREPQTLLNSLVEMKPQSRSIIEKGLEGVSRLVLNEYGSGTFCQIILITDGSIGPSTSHANQRINSIYEASGKENQNQTSTNFPLPFPFPSKLLILSLVDEPADEVTQLSNEFYRKLIALNRGNGALVQTKDLRPSSMDDATSKLCSEHISTFIGTLKFGHLSSPIQLSPTIQSVTAEGDFEDYRLTPSSTIDIVGFLELADVASAHIESRHLVVPLAKDDDGKIVSHSTNPCFCVILHGALRLGALVGLCEIAPLWYGLVFPCMEAKKRSNLMLATLSPGLKPVEWLGNVTQLAPIADFCVNPYQAKKSPFRIQSSKRSYATQTSVWLRPNGIQGEFQKLTRYSRKFPDKRDLFYKELNRVRRIALALGFESLLDGMAAILEKEAQQMPGGASPDCCMQLTHAASQLRSPAGKDHRIIIKPLKTDF